MNKNQLHAPADLPPGKVALLPIEVSARNAQPVIFLMGIELRTSQLAAQLLYRLEESGLPRAGRSWVLRNVDTVP